MTQVLAAAEHYSHEEQGWSGFPASLPLGFRLQGTHGEELRQGLVRVVLEGYGATVNPEVQGAVGELGGQVEATYEELVQALVPVTALDDLSNLVTVRFVRPPVVAVADQLSTSAQGSVVGQGVAAIGADRWQGAGFRGQGIKIAILDHGFRNYRQLLGNELPREVIARNFRADGKFEDTVHGTAVAEIIHDIAPEGQLYLAAIATEVELFRAVDWLLSQQVNIISMSLSFFTGCFHDNGGRGYFDSRILQRVRQQGTLWINSAGNYARSHWSGIFRDQDDDGRHEFSGSDESQSLQLEQGETIHILLSWDEACGNSTQDLDLYLLNSQGQIIAASNNLQRGTGSPWEFVSFESSQDGTYQIEVRRVRATRSPQMKLFVYGDVGVIEHYVRSGSLPEPPISPNVAAVAAVFWNRSQCARFSRYMDQGCLLWYSSQGPTTDGRTKPDLAAPTHVSVSAQTYGAYVQLGTERDGFGGTSASAPHVAGAAALVKGAFPDFTPDQMQQYLESNAEDYGLPGKDNKYGSGYLQLPAPPGAPPAPTIQVNPTNLQFTGTTGADNPSSQSLTITNSGGGTLNWQAAPSVPWVQLNPRSGTAPSTLTANVRISGLTAGTHTGQITISAQGATNSPVTVSVTLELKPEDRPSSFEFAASLEQGVFGRVELPQSLRGQIPVGVRFEERPNTTRGERTSHSLADIGLQLAISTGSIFGTPTQAGDFQFLLEAQLDGRVVAEIWALMTINERLHLLALKVTQALFITVGWERTLRDGCVIYTNSSESTGKVQLQLANGEGEEHRLPVGSQLLMCMDVVHIESLGDPSPLEALGIVGSNPVAAVFQRLEFGEPARWERSSRESCVVYKNIHTDANSITVTLSAGLVSTFKVAVEQELFVCRNVLHLLPYDLGNAEFGAEGGS